MGHKVDLNFILKLEGDGIDAFGVDVKDLAPSLLSLGELIQRTHELVNPNHKKIDVNVRAFQKGSFVVDLAMYTSNIATELYDSFTSIDFETLKQELEWVGIIKDNIEAGKSIFGGGLLGLILWLKGKKPKTRVQLENTLEYEYENEKGEKIKVSSQIAILHDDNQIHDSIQKVIKPLLSENINQISTFLKEQQAGTQITLSQNEALILSQSRNTMIDFEKDILEQEMYLRPHSGSYKGAKTNRKFYAMGNIPIEAKILDLNFLNDLEEGFKKLHHNDRLKVRIRQIFDIKEGKTDYFNPKYEIIKILDYVPYLPVQQLKLDTTSGKKSPPDQKPNESIL
jgi:hypothetical protein